MKASEQTLHITLLTIELHIPFSRSLKDKRSAIRSIKDQLRAKFNASVVEFAYQDKWQRAMIGVCMISGDKRKLESDRDLVRQLCEEMPQVEIADFRQEWL